MSIARRSLNGSLAAIKPLTLSPSMPAATIKLGLSAINNGKSTYFVTELLGPGGFGSTFKAISYNTQTGESGLVAIKFIYPTAKSSREAADEISRFKEIVSKVDNKNMTSIECQVNLLCYYDSGTVGPSDSNYPPLVGLLTQQADERKKRQFDLSQPIIYIVTEFLDGKDLFYVMEDNIKANYPPAASELGTFLHDMLTAIEYMHSRHIAHMDIKPENIIRTRIGRYVLIDFGLSCSSRRCISRGTPSYMTNELLALNAVSDRSFDSNVPFVLAAGADFFALALTLQNYSQSATLQLDLGGILHKSTDLKSVTFVADWLEFVLRELLFNYNYYADRHNVTKLADIYDGQSSAVNDLLYVVASQTVPKVLRPPKWKKGNLGFVTDVYTEE